jgi:putative alpha-1,2-mannosidase
VAQGLEKTADVQKYLNRSRNWRNYWNPDLTSKNQSGFLIPRHANGSFIDQDPLGCGGCYWSDSYYEETCWAYSMNPHYDIRELIKRVGGKERFVDRLEKIFEGGLKGGKEVFDPSNEPSFATPYLYNFASRQDLSVKRSRSIARSYYGIGPGALPGNSDAGAMRKFMSTLFI